MPKATLFSKKDGRPNNLPKVPGVYWFFPKASEDLNTVQYGVSLLLGFCAGTAFLFIFILFSALMLPVSSIACPLNVGIS